MRKIFFLIPALLIAMMMNAATTPVSAGAGTLSDAIANASAGDVLVLGNGEFTESSAVGINKDLVIKAAVEKTSTLKIIFGIEGGARVEFQGVNFDASIVESHLIYANDATAGNELILDGCELYGDTANQALIHVGSTEKLDACTINNCYFHNITKSCFFNENTGAIDVTLTNTTIANVGLVTTYSDKYYAGVIDSRGTSGKLRVDHCTFYNVNVKNTDYAAIGKIKTSDAIVSNCIFALPAPGSSNLRTVRDHVTVNNCLVYNYTTDSNYGMQGDVTKNNCMIADPQFAAPDAATPDFSFAANNWVTMSLSPAIGVATDGTDLGDPRWHKTGTLPATDFTSAYDLLSTKAVLSGRIELNDNNHIKFKHNSTTADGLAVWRIHVNRVCAVSAVAIREAESTSGCQLILTARDADGNILGESLNAAASYNANDIQFPGTICFPEAGDYTIVLSNSMLNSGAIIDKITLSYAGGAVVDIPSTLNINDAIHNGTVVDGAITFTNATTGTAEWKVALATEAYVNIATTIKNQYGHNITVAIFEEDGVTPVDQVSEGGNKYTKDAEGLLINLGGMYLKAGNYVVKYSNATDGSDAKLVNVALTYVGGAVQNLPGTTDINDAWFSDNGTRADGKITYPESTLGWAKWNINVASAGTYNVTVNIQNQYGHNFTVEFLKEGESTPISIDEGGTKYGHDATLYPVAVGSIALEAGNYEMKVSNAIGDAALLSVTLAYAGGAAIDLSKTTPASLLANADAILSDDWSIEEGKIVHAESKALTGWAKWNVDCADDGNYNVIVNISSDNGHLVRVEVFEDENDPAIYTLDEATATKYTTGDLAIDLGNIALEDKEYVFKVSNTVSSSHVQIASIVITYKGGAVITIPNADIPFADAMLSANAYIDGDGLHFSDADHKSHVDQEWAKWNIHASAGAYTFTFNVNGPDHGIYKIEVLDGNNSVLSETYGHTGEGSYTTNPVYLDGDYVVQMQNTNNYSMGYMTVLSAAQVTLLELDDDATVNTVIHDNYRNGTHNIRVNRTILGGMYNAICLPFDVNSDKLQSVFGSDVELYQMASAIINGQVLDLRFDATTSIYRGTPYLIKTSADVIDPIFSDVEIKEEAGGATSGEAANFKGTFVAKDFYAGNQVLLLMSNNVLVFPQSDKTLKGFRAYFEINNPSNAPIRRAQIVTGSQVVTSIDLVNVENNGTLKTIENGQLIIIKNGVRYNVQGQVIRK